MAVAGPLDAAEGELNLCPDRRCVDINDARLQLVDGSEGAVDVVRVDGQREAVSGVVGDLDGLLKGIHRDDRDAGAEDLLLRDPHGGVYLAEDGRGVEIAVVQPILGQHAASSEDPGPLGLADLGVRIHALELVGVDDGTQLDVRLEAVPDLERFGTRHQLLLHVAQHLSLHDQARAGGAPLAGRAEAAPDRAVEHQIQVGVVHHDDGVLAAHLQRDALEVAAAGLGDEAAHLA